jgi:hypothetical protein
MTGPYSVLSAISLHNIRSPKSSSAVASARATAVGAVSELAPGRDVDRPPISPMLLRAKETQASIPGGYCMRDHLRRWKCGSACEEALVQVQQARRNACVPAKTPETRHHGDIETATPTPRWTCCRPEKRAAFWPNRSLSVQERIASYACPPPTSWLFRMSFGMLGEAGK